MRIMQEIQRKPDGIITFVTPTHLDTRLNGWGNGYVAVPKGHIFYGIDYEHLWFDVHGGVTWSEIETIDGIDYYVLGFDTAHSGDSPKNRPKEYVIEETERFYQQVISNKLHWVAIADQNTGNAYQVDIDDCSIKLALNCDSISHVLNLLINTHNVDSHKIESVSLITRRK